MSDVRLNDKSVASDAAYIYAETASGEQVRISKADLATVVAEQIKPLKIHSDITEGDLNTYMFNGVSYMNPSTAESIINAPIDTPYGMLFSLNLNTSAFQLCILYDTRVFFRVHWGGSWGNWVML